MFHRSNLRARLNELRERNGAILVLAAIFLIVVFAFTAFTVDVGFISLTRTQMQAAADASALAAAMELTSDSNPATVRQNAQTAAQEVAANFRNGDRSSVTLKPSSDIEFGKTIVNGNGQTEMVFGTNQTPYNIVKVRVRRGTDVGANGQTEDNRIPLFFGPALGTSKSTIATEAVAGFQPRDIVLVLDFSGSMNDDSCLGAIGKLGRTYVESNLQTMWTQLGGPVYGNLAFTPKYATLSGLPVSGTMPHIDVTFKRSSIVVTSTSALKKVTLKMSGNKTQTFSSLSGTTGTFQGTGSNSGRDITACYVESGTNTNRSPGGLGEYFQFTTANIKTALGLTGAYPYPGGSWDEFITEVQKSSGSIKDAGYRDMYGYLTWLQYLQTVRYSNDDTPDLWKTNEQPVTCLKDGVDLFIDFLADGEGGDYVGLVVYTHQNTAGAILEHPLSTNRTQIKTTTRQRQAGHYQSGTNISGGMLQGRVELQTNARGTAEKVMILMTDGQANLPGNSTSARQAVLSEAQVCANKGIKVVTITVGLDADVDLMQQVADMTGGECFVVPGDQTIAGVRAQLLEVFRRIASTRGLKLMK